MNAIKFIKDYGFTQAKECLSICASPNDKWFIHNGVLVSDSDFDDLKRLVESVDLVREHYTLDRAIDYANSAYTAPEIKVCLLDAIADYKSIYGGEHV